MVQLFLNEFLLTVGVGIFIFPSKPFDEHLAGASSQQKHITDVLQGKTLDHSDN